jgi:hypothetical protein
MRCGESSQACHVHVSPHASALHPLRRHHSSLVLSFGSVYSRGQWEVFTHKQWCCSSGSVGARSFPAWS